jgi:hypothetical protein
LNFGQPDFVNSQLRLGHKADPRMKKIPIDTIPLFARLDALLLELLGSLTDADWQRPTLAKRWTVKDVTAHLLDISCRTISTGRDNYSGERPPPIQSYQDLVAWLNELNGSWVNAARRLSPRLLIELLEFTAPLHRVELAKADPWSDSKHSVAWAGETVSKNWFHIAREYTEKYHHQLQIRDAVNQSSPLMTRELFFPFISTLMYGLPHAYRDMNAVEGTVVLINITTSVGGSWQLIKHKDGWSLVEDEWFENDETALAAIVSIPPDIAWKLFTKGIAKEEAVPFVQIDGDKELGEKALTLIAVIA